MKYLSPLVSQALQIDPPRPNTSPRRRVTNDGSSGRGQNYNIIFHASLPPSTGTGRSINIDRMEQGYTTIAESINNLAYQQRIWKRIDVNKDLQHHVQLRAELRASGADELMISTVTQTTYDLQEERGLSGDYERYFQARISSMMDHENYSLSTSRSSDNNHSDSMDTEKTNVQ